MKTNVEKIQTTSEFLFEKQKEEILSELFWIEKYTGYVDIWFELIPESKEIKLEVFHKKILSLKTQLSHDNAIRFELIRDKGVKQVV